MTLENEGGVVGLSLTYVEPVDTLMRMQDARRARECPPAVPGPERWTSIIDAGLTGNSFDIHVSLNQQVCAKTIISLTP